MVTKRRTLDAAQETSQKAGTYAPCDTEPRRGSCASLRVAVLHLEIVDKILQYLRLVDLKLCRRISWGDYNTRYILWAPLGLENAVFPPRHARGVAK